MSVEDLIALVVTADADGLKEGLNNGLKAFVNTPNPDGFFPLHIAVKARHAHIAQILLEAGASPSVASEEAGSHKGYTPIHFAASEGDVDLMKLLFKHKAEVNVPAADGWFPLHIASFKGKRVAMELLLDQGAIVDCENSHSFTPLTFAVSHGRLGDVRFLIERGASTTVTDKKGDSLLHHCFQYQVAKMFEGDYDVPEAQLDVAVALVLNGADHTRTNIDGCEATFYYKDDIPSLDEALQLMHDYRAIFTTSSKEWNYMSFVSASTLNFISLGLPPAAAEKFVPIMASVDKERLESKALRLEEQANSGGCPVMRSRKKPKDQPAAPTDGSDPSGGKCPFFQNKTNAADGTVPAGHPPVNAEQMRAAGADPSGGKCPFFQKKGETVMALDDPNRPLCPFSRAFARRHQRTLLLMSISFVFGVLCSQLFLQK